MHKQVEDAEAAEFMSDVDDLPANLDDDLELDQFYEPITGGGNHLKKTMGAQADLVSVDEDNDELDSIYSELDQSMAQKKSQLVTVPNATCSVCLRQQKGNATCIVLSQQCGHQACIDCIQSKITEPI